MFIITPVLKFCKANFGRRRTKMENVTEKITNVIAEYLDKDPSEIVATNTFTQNGLDSLDIMELVMQIEEELDCKIELSQEINTIEKLAQYVEAHKGE